MQLFALVNSGATVSGDIDLRKHVAEAIFATVMTSGDLLVQGSFDTTSANFVRLLEPHGAVASGDLRIPFGVGSRFATFPRDSFTPPYMRLETSVAQTSPASFAILARPRLSSR